MTKREAIKTLVECWLDDGQVQNLHQAWIVLAKSIGREDEAREVSAVRTDDEPEPR
jgi:hypothetical protein